MPRPFWRDRGGTRSDVSHLHGAYSRRQETPIANAPHLPPHLGSMGDAVRAILSRQRAGLRSGVA